MNDNCSGNGTRRSAVQRISFHVITMYEVLVCIVKMHQHIRPQFSGCYICRKTSQRVQDFPLGHSYKLPDCSTVSACHLGLTIPLSLVPLHSSLSASCLSLCRTLVSLQAFTLLYIDVSNTPRMVSIMDNLNYGKDKSVMLSRSLAGK